MLRALCISAICVFSAPALAQKTVSSPEHHFTMEYSSSKWIEQAAIADNGNASLSEEQAKSVHFVTGFVPAMFRKGSETYALVEFVRGDLDRVRLEDIQAHFERESGAGTTSLGSFADAVKSAAVRSPVLDAGRGVAVYDTSEGTGPDALQCRTAAYVTRDGIIEVRCYARSEHFAKDLEKFIPLLSAVKIDPSVKYESGERRLRRKGEGSSMSFSYGRGYFLGGGVGGLGLVGFILRRLLASRD